MKRGLFITFEGGEGGGKSTQLPIAAEYLRQQGIAVIMTREPGGTVVGESIRAVLLNPELPAMHPDTELLLMFAARNEHIQRTILPALNQGQWVLCDRFTDATYAYQGFGRGLNQDRIAKLETWVQGVLRPDHTLLFDLAVDIGMGRAKKRGAADRFEQEHLAFFERIRAGYLARAQQYPQQYRIVQAEHSLEQVTAQMLHYLDEFMAEVGR
ncbi:MAG: dTMP kinase [Thiofilum sp.]|uniref:dTMP kinase n=1 Tax=Thiofilum sp. TaxID=2212733 RepID=UPI0025ED0945|nr:dTMP kinase [Thiofilum sp.]MBK8454497.1 dTMP kinase [Thiofilum sp.]